MVDLATDLSLKVLSIYQEIDQKTARLGLAFGLRCPSLCGACCDSPKVEATVLETLPLAEEIYRRKEEAALLIALEKKRNQDDFKCVLYRANPGPGTGRCSYYEFRPLICRLFGFAFRRNKLGNLEFAACKVMKERPPEAGHRFESAISETLGAPVYQESFMRIALLDPGMGYRCLPINWALREALERLYWKTGRICQISDNEKKGKRSVRP